MMGEDQPNPWNLRNPKGELRSLSSLLDSGVFPGTQGGPLEHIIAAKAVAFGEALQPSFKDYTIRVRRNAIALATAMVNRGYHLISGGTDNHLMLIDLRNKSCTGKQAEQALGRAHITINKTWSPLIPLPRWSPAAYAWGLRLLPPGA